MTEEQKQVLKDISEKYDLNKDHFFVSKHFIIVNKIGIEKIAKEEEINFAIKVIETNKDYSAIECIGHGKIRSAWAYASAFSGNSHNNYYLEMAIKRAKAKAVLEIIGAYQKGIYSESEADEFKQDGEKK